MPCLQRWRGAGPASKFARFWLLSVLLTAVAALLHISSIIALARSDAYDMSAWRESQWFELFFQADTDVKVVLGGLKLVTPS